MEPKRWPRKGSRKMRSVVAGVEATASEDAVKALRLLQKTRARSYHTSRRAGGSNAKADKELGSIVRRLSRLLGV